MPYVAALRTAFINFCNCYRFGGYQKIKGLKEFFVYRNPASGQKEIGAKTKNGDIHEFQIRGLMMTNEFQELKQFVLNGL